MKVVQLHPVGAFSTDLRSDTLWGLIIYALANLYDESFINELLAKFDKGEPPFLVSSCFPFKITDNKIKHFLPKPILSPVKNQSELDLSELKKIKKQKYIELEAFNQLINNSFDKNNFGEFETLEKSFESEMSVKIMINRLTNGTTNEQGEGQLFNTFDFYIDKGGLYFFVEGNVELIEQAMRFLQHFGLGGNRSRGKGFFNYEISEIDLELPTSDDSWMSLSLYHPKIDELSEFKNFTNKLWYDIELRQGKIGMQFKIDEKYHKKPIFNFVEGSVFPHINRNNYGKIIETHSNNDKKIYSYGFAFKIPIKFNGD